MVTCLRHNLTIIVTSSPMHAIQKNGTCCVKLHKWLYIVPDRPVISNGGTNAEKASEFLVIMSNSSCRVVGHILGIQEILQIK